MSEGSRNTSGWNVEEVVAMLPMKTADLLLVHGTSFVDRVIEVVSRSKYSHVAGIVKENELIESLGFRKTGYQGIDTYRGHSDLFTCDILTDDQRKQIVQFAVKQVGTRYDYFLIAWEAEHFLLGVDVPFHEHGRFDCSTLWADAYRSVDVDLCPGIPFPTPGDLAKSKLMRKVGSFSPDKPNLHT
jgi:uncharacterized protein YycO